MMKKTLLALALFLPVFAMSGCGGHSGGSTVEDAEQSAIDAYLEQEKKDQAEMDATLDAK